MITRRLPRLSNTDGRVRLSCGSLEWQTRQVQPTVGTPIDVPEPITVSRREEGSVGSEEDTVSQGSGTRLGFFLHRFGRRLRQFHEREFQAAGYV